MRTITTSSVEKTQKLAADFARKLKKGDVVALSGGLGAGKTTFVKGMARALGVKEFVKSPTFNLLHIYQAKKFPLFHFDFYRLETVDLDELGFEEYFYKPDGITVLEWAEKVKTALPRGAKRVSLKYVSEEKRSISFK